MEPAGDANVDDREDLDLDTPQVQGAKVEMPAHSTTERLEDLLAEYWGADWTQVRAKLVDAGYDLTQAFELEPWEQVEPKMRALLLLDEDGREAIVTKYVKWPEQLDAGWMRKELQIPIGEVTEHLSEQDLQEMQALALPYNLELEADAEAYVNGLDRALEGAWLSGRFVRAPLTTEGAPIPQPTTCFFATGKVSGGWAVSLCLDRESHPYLVDIRERLKSARSRRNEALREFFWSRIRR